MLTNRKSRFDTIVKNSFMTEKRLMIDVNAAREAYQKLEISDIGHVDDPDNPADGLTKAKQCNGLNTVLQTGTVNHEVNQWVVRNDRSVFTPHD